METVSYIPNLYEHATVEGATNQKSKGSSNIDFCVEASRRRLILGHG
jgi:hypothetical protein